MFALCLDALFAACCVFSYIKTTPHTSINTGTLFCCMQFTHSYGTVKESEADQMLRNKALIIDEIESTLTDAVVQDLNSRCAAGEQPPQYTFKPF
jgi:hypothetical protein